jgi:tryptophan-rich sensory protein
MKMYLWVFFLLLNFAALALGGLLQGEGAGSTWYRGLDTAPWTPPGWIFGAAWTTIMICYAFYAAGLFKKVNKKLFITLYSVQWILNAFWNFVFFNLHRPFEAFIMILALYSLLILQFVLYFNSNRLVSLWLLPYIIWLTIAITLNGYVL